MVVQLLSTKVKLRLFDLLYNKSTTNPQQIEAILATTCCAFAAVCGPKFTKFLHNVGDPSYFQTPLRIVCVTFRSEDIRH